MLRHSEAVSIVGALHGNEFEEQREKGGEEGEGLDPHLMIPLDDRATLGYTGSYID